MAEQVIVEHETGKNEDFSLVLGGPVYQLLVRFGLIKPPFGKLGWRVAATIALTWLPLVPLTILSGRFAGGVKVPFLYDFEVHARLLFSLPLMVLAELVVYRRMRALVVQFVERQIITDNVRSAFNAVVSSSQRLRNSPVAEIAMLLCVFVAGPFIWREALALRSDAWYATTTSAGLTHTWAGQWYTHVSVPAFQFILIRWYYRIFIWSRFLFQVTRLDLNLMPLHPDRCCGLGFLGSVAAAFAPLLTAHSGVAAGFVANRIVHDGATLPEYKFELVALLVFLLLIVLGPLCVFIPKLHHAKLAGLRTYGRLASDYVVSFAGKWTRETKPESEPLLGSADIQSMADLDNSFNIVREAKVVPFGRETIMQFVVAIALPLLPLALTMFSLEELLKRLLKVFL